MSLELGKIISYETAAKDLTRRTLQLLYAKEQNKVLAPHKDFQTSADSIGYYVPVSPKSAISLANFETLNLVLYQDSTDQTKQRCAALLADALRAKYSVEFFLDSYYDKPSFQDNYDMPSFIFHRISCNVSEELNETYEEINSLLKQRAKERLRSRYSLFTPPADLTASANQFVDRILEQIPLHLTNNPEAANILSRFATDPANQFGRPRQLLASLTVRTRVLGIPTVADRVAQAVAKDFLEPIVEPKFHPDSYGYRPKEIGVGCSWSSKRTMLASRLVYRSRY